MLDERGKEIDLDVVDAVGRLPDGRYDVWLKDERRVITGNPTFFEEWMKHIRSKQTEEQQDKDPSRTWKRGKNMLARNTVRNNPTLDNILQNLSIADEPYNQFYRTSTQEDYKLLVKEALSGQLDGVVSVSRSGIYLNELLITPPTNT